MQPPDDGHGSSSRRSGRAFRLLYASTDPDPAVTEAMKDRYRVTLTNSVREATAELAGGADCLVVDDTLYHPLEDVLFDAPDTEPIPVVAFTAAADPRLVRSVARRPEFDVVYETPADDGTAGTALERLGERIDAACERRAPDLDAPTLETAGLLMSAAPDEVDTRIEWGLRLVGEALGATRCVVYERTGEELDRTHEWASDGADKLRHGPVPTASFPGFEGTIDRFEPFVAGPDPSTDAEPSPSELGYEGSFVALPVVVDWNTEWVLAVGGAHPSAASDSVLSRLETVGELISHTIRRHRRHREIERQNERLERFASVISHDLQNPLGVVKGFAELAVESGDPADIERISTAAERMETILDDLYTLACEAEDLGDRERIDVSNAFGRARSAVETGDLTVETDRIGTVDADPGRLQQAFENLLRNAVEHAGGGVTIRLTPIEDGFAIEDDGRGIPVEKRDSVFEEGYTDDGGTGLGLSIVRTVLEAHGWSVSLTDSERGGARFEVTGVRFVTDDPPATATT